MNTKADLPPHAIAPRTPAMTRFFFATAPAAITAPKGSHHARVRSTVAGARSDVMNDVARSAPTRARLANFRRAVLA